MVFSIWVRLQPNSIKKNLIRLGPTFSHISMKINFTLNTLRHFFQHFKMHINTTRCLQEAILHQIRLYLILDINVQMYQLTACTS